jgi:hypothetical protein
MVGRPRRLPLARAWRRPAFHSLLDERPLKLGHGADDLEHQPTGGRAEVEVVPQADERNSAGLEFGQGINQVTKRAAEPVQPHRLAVNPCENGEVQRCNDSLAPGCDPV